MAIKIKFKKLHPDAVIPFYAKYGDAGMDLTTTSRVFDEYGNVAYGTGLAMEIPTGFVALLFPRSSNSKKDLLLCNSVGVVDSGYRGEVILKFKPAAMFADWGEHPDGEIGYIGDTYEHITLPNENYSALLYEIGDRVGQLVIMALPFIDIEEVEELSESERGEGGFGSTNK